MKAKHIFIAALIAISVYNIKAQSQNWWRVNGNTPAAGDFFGTTTNFPINFKVNNVQKMMLDANGNLNLNNLAGSGNRVLLTDATGKIISLPSGIAGQFLQSDGTWGSLPGGATSWSVSGGNLISTNTGNIGIGVSNPLYKLSVMGNANITGNLLVGGGVITTNSLNTTVKLNAGDVDVTNNLNVTGNTAFTGSVVLSSLTGTAAGILYVNPNGSLFRQAGLGNTAPCLQGAAAWFEGGNQNPYDNTIGTCSSGAFILKSNNNPKIWLTGTGQGEKIGFGTGTPTEQFHFKGGNILLNGENNVGQNLFKLTLNDNNKKAIVVQNIAITNVGYENFLVWGNGKTQVGWQLNAPNNALLNINTNGGEAINIFDGITNQLNFKVGPDGKTQIGLDQGVAPNAMLYANGNVGGNVVEFWNAANNIYRLNSVGSTTLTSYAPNGTDDIFSIIDATPLSPTQGVNFKVKRSGIVYAREIYVWSGPFPDYVFTKDYKLLALNKLKEYIIANKHLPNMPTATEVNTNGMQLGELSRLQTEKIEELTLYVIQLKEELDALKKETLKNK